ncbi:hypothetical protein EVAR_12381_1 [Eumeta japonica]|uniref:Uncharacterized protein n=1 Tax=Eumeta variegata TaxID=151549 RepID=A0A4C1TZC7_EUMVA|nr:hypothetical protein EVAR_12381_1 [Eumeta japonica]
METDLTEEESRRNLTKYHLTWRAVKNGVGFFHKISSPISKKTASVDIILQKFNDTDSNEPNFKIFRGSIFVIGYGGLVRKEVPDGKRGRVGNRQDIVGERERYIFLRDVWSPTWYKET